MAISKGKVKIIDGVYQPVSDSQLDRRVRRGNVRMDMVKQGIPPRFEYRSSGDGKRTFEMGIKCFFKTNILQSGAAVEIDNYVRTEKTFRRIGEKNITRQVKNNVCEYSGYYEASKVRKRIIAIQKLKSLDDQEFLFDI